MTEIPVFDTAGRTCALVRGRGRLKMEGLFIFGVWRDV